ncbi:hypothetical protein HY989_03455 [Candidatus Micrarchaeota archaeon]|nr:hypothetical protein [Candidatus Micrarchaeota archaeon]
MVDNDTKDGNFSINEGSMRYKEISGNAPEESPIEKFKSFLLDAKNAVVSNPAPFVIFILLVVGVLAYLALTPKKAALSIGISLKDSPGTPITKATISLLYKNEKAAVPDVVTDELGNVQILGVPAGEDLTLKIIPASDDLVSYRKTIKLENKATDSLDVFLEKKSNLVLDKENYDILAAPSCESRLEVSVTNLALSSFSTSLVFDDALKKYFIADEEVEIPSNKGEESLIAKTTLMGDAPSEISGIARLKYTSKEIAVRIKKSDKKPKLDLVFDKSEVKDFRVKEADLPITKKTQLRLKNTGLAGGPNLMDLDVAINGDIKNWAEMDVSTIASANQKGGIAAGSEVLFPLSISVPLGTAPGTYTSQLVATSACGDKAIPLYVRVE